MRHVTGAIVAQQPWLVSDPNLGEGSGFQSQVQRVLNIGCGHGLEQLLGDDVAGVIVQDRRQVIPAPADNPEISEVGLPEFVHTPGRMLEAIAGRHDDVSRAGDQVAPLQNPVHAGFGDEVGLGVGDLPGQLAG